MPATAEPAMAIWCCCDRTVVNIDLCQASRSRTVSTTLASGYRSTSVRQTTQPGASTVAPKPSYTSSQSIGPPSKYRRQASDRQGAVMISSMW